jgi:alginate O-acetyltransferase complex protein AlgJ
MPAIRDPLALPRVPPAAPATHPWRDRMVTALFALALGVPLVALTFSWSRTMTLFENRPMAPWPALELARSFPPELERAFGDRFGGRDLLIRLHHAALIKFFGVSGLAAVLPGRDGWYYWLGEDTRSLDRYYRGVVPFSQREVDATAAELIRRRAWLAARGIAYVVAVAPEKFTIYPEYLPGWAAKSGQPTPYDRVAEALRADGRVAFVDLRPALLAAKARGRIYYRTDSHWNYDGAIVGYEAIMRAVQRELPPGRLTAIAPPWRPAYVPGRDVFTGDLGNLLGLEGWIREEGIPPPSQRVADPAGRCARRTDDGSSPGIEVYVCDRPGLPRALVYRDSMADALIPMLAENFSRIVFVMGRQLDPALIEREHPDVLIEELVERMLDNPGAVPM